MYKRLRFLFSFLNDNNQVCYKLEGDTNYFEKYDTIYQAGSNDGSWFTILSIEDDVMILKPNSSNATVIFGAWYIYKSQYRKYNPRRDRYRGKLNIVGWSPYKIDKQFSNIGVILNDIDFYTRKNGFYLERVYTAVHKYLYRYGDKYVAADCDGYTFHSCDLFEGTFIVKT